MVKQNRAFAYQCMREARFIQTEFFMGTMQHLQVSRVHLRCTQLDSDCLGWIHFLSDHAREPADLPSTPYRMLADSCQFELLDVDALQDPASGRLLHLYSLVARCLSCETVFKAEEGQGLVSHSRRGWCDAHRLRAAGVQAGAAADLAPAGVAQA
jgi:hypothetical protein